MAGLLRRKGARVIAGFHTRGEVAYPAPALKGRFSNRPDDIDLAEAANFARHISNIASGKGAGDLPQRYKSPLFSWDFYSLLAFLITDKIIRLLMPKPRYLAQRCKKHGSCKENCPMAAISISPGPVVDRNRCIRCYRCVNTCPEQAWSLKWGWADRLIALVYNIPMERWLGTIKEADKVY